MNPAPLDLPEDELSFLRDLVKGSRQKTHQVAWTDRDGVKRLTVLNQTEVVRLNAIAGRLRISKVEMMRQAAYIPAVRGGASPASGAPGVGEGAEGAGREGPGASSTEGSA
ncbi:MAG: hypothetical protein V4773_08105 [Verrucomicrobiota bacterium]